MDQIEKNRKRLSFKIFSFIVRFISHKPKFIFKDEKGFSDGPFLILSNHAGRKAPTKIDQYFKFNPYMWGTHEMTEGVKGVQKYLTTTYFHEKKHWPKVIAKIIGTIVAPLVNGYYRGLRLIPTYQDGRFFKTVKTSVKKVQNGSSIVIFPEDSSLGYKAKIEWFFSGFCTLLDSLLRANIDLPIYVIYLQTKNNTFYVDAPVMYSSIKEQFNGNKDDIAHELRKRMNSLADIYVPKQKKNHK